MPGIAAALNAPSVDRRVLREQIRDYLVQDILEGRRAPGDRIVETRVARDFNVSQTPVREALRDLEVFGFVVVIPFRGAVVRETSIEDLLQVYPIRAMLEGLAARHAATRISEPGLKKLATLLQRMRKAAACGDHRAMRRRGSRFPFHHRRGIWKLAPHAILGTNEIGKLHLHHCYEDETFVARNRGAPPPSPGSVDCSQSEAG